MALNPSAAYSGQINTTDPTGYPYGRAKNVAAIGDGTGTPLEQQWVSDLFGFEQALLTAAGLTPSGTPDKVGASQYLDSLIALISKNLTQATNWPERGSGAFVGIVNNAPPIAFLSGANNVGVPTVIGRWCAIDLNGVAHTSDDGTIWAARGSVYSGGGHSISGVASGFTGGFPCFIAVDSIAHQVYTSIDWGVSWVATGVPATTLTCIAYAAGLNLWAAADSGSIVTSPDGNTWTSRTVPGGWSSAFPSKIVSNGTFFVMLQSGSSGNILSSPDGITWTVRAVGLSATWKSVAWSSSEACWLLVSLAGDVYRSTDGITWTAATAIGSMLGTATVQSIAVNRNLWIVSSLGAASGVFWSQDKGATWNRANVGDHSGTLQGYARVLAADGRFMLVRTSTTAIESVLSLRSS